jgi:hypothetical protein
MDMVRPTVDRGAQRRDLGIYLAPKRYERCGDSHRNQPTRHRVFHNGQAILVPDELQCRSLDCLQSHFTHLIPAAMPLTR